MKDFFRNLYHRNYRFSKFKILGRVACLGNEIITQLNLHKGLINHQKSRIDYLLKINLEPELTVISKEITPLLERKYIAATIKQQEIDFFSYKKPDLIVMDSFSELTDQLFISKKDGKMFLANFSDINHDDNFTHSFNYAGLIDAINLEKIYDQFFYKIRTTYGGVPILFFHFPTKLDERLNFQRRGQDILKALNLLSDQHQNLYSISVSDADIIKSNEETDELKDFPYHYGKTTYAAFIKQTKSIINDHFRF